RLKVSKASEVYNLLLQSWDMNKIDIVEHFKIVLLNRAGKVLGVSTISTGGLSGTVVDLKLLFAIALKAGASEIILAHNHPSGRLEPSTQDKAITRKIVEAGRLLELPVVEHLIISREGYYSFAEEGLI